MSQGKVVYINNSSKLNKRKVCVCKILVKRGEVLWEFYDAINTCSDP